MSSLSSSSPQQFEARQLSLPRPLYAPSPQIHSLLYDTVSSSLALHHSDSSFSLYPSFSPLSLPSLPAPQALIPSPTSSAAFLHVKTSPSSTTTLFVSSSPLLRPSAAVTLLRFYLLRDGRFGKIRVVSNHKDMEFDGTKFGVVFKVNHGVSMRLSGGINFFTLHSVSNSKIWVFAVRLVVDDGGGEALKLMKCAVIDCCFRVSAIRVLFGLLILGEENGVRIFLLQLLVKGKIHRKEKSIGKRFSFQNGSSNGGDAPKSDKHSSSAKLMSVKLRQDSKNVGAFFVAFEDRDVESSISTKISGRSVKAVSVEALSSRYFVILDSVGDVHLLTLSQSAQGLNNTCHMKRLNQNMKVLKLAVFHEVSTVTKTIWMSDGCHTVHHMMVSGIDASLDKTEKEDNTEKPVQTSVTQAIFTSEKIQHIVPLSANAVLILGQGNVFAYAIS